MLKLTAIKKHHIAIASLIALTTASIYQSVVPLPEASADTVTIIIDTEATISPTAEIPCGNPAGDDGDCGIGSIMYYLDSYLSRPSNAISKQFHVILGNSVHRINLDRTITLNFPRSCSNCSLEIDGTDSTSTKGIITSALNRDGSTPSNGIIISDNTNPITLKNFRFQNFNDTAVRLESISAITASITDNIFGDTASGGSNAHGLVVNNTSNAIINNNIFGGHSSDAFIVSGDSSNNRISNNLFGINDRTDLTSNLPAIHGNGISFEAGSHDITVDSNNIFANTTANGIQSNGNTITITGGNIFFNNGQKAIAIGTGSNNNVDTPTLASAEKAGSNLIIKGSGTSGATINFYRTNNSSSPTVTPDSSGGEGFAFLGTVTIDSLSDHNSNRDQFEFTLSADIPLGQSISSFQTSNNNSSTFSNNVTVISQSSPTPTPTPTTPAPTPTPSINHAPVANAGNDQTSTIGSQVTLHGESSSDSDNDTLLFQWIQSSADRYQVALNATTVATPTFTAPSSISELQTDLHFTLQVSDGHGGNSADSVIIHITRSTQRPVANLQILPSTRVAPGTEIILDGSESIFDSATTTHEYHFTAQPASDSTIQISINQTSLSNAQARVLIPGGLTTTTSFTFVLQVNDGTDSSLPVSQTVQAVPQATSTQLCTDSSPVADAGKNQIITKPTGTIVVLNGQRSNDPNNTALNYSWTQLAGGPRVDLRNTASISANFTIPTLSTTETTLTFSLQVTNHCGGSDSATVKVTIKNNDIDNDGLANDQEIALGTDLTVADSDQDGLNDGLEVNAHCLSPLNPDSDNDGLKDGEEDINHNGITDVGETNACIYDTDGDSLPDGYERNNQLNPSDPSDANTDPDNDSLINKEEFVYKTNPHNADSDSDGLNDGIEIKGSNHTAANDDDTDNDGIVDGNEDINHNGITDANETSPVRFDSDFDGLSDGQEIGLGKAQGKNTDSTKFFPDIDPTTKTSPLSPDSDNDKLPDGMEDTNRNGSFDCGETDPMNSVNTPKSCVATTNKPIIKPSSKPSIGITVQKPSAVTTPKPSGGLVQLVSPQSNFSISVQKGNTNSQLTLPSVSILVLPAALLSNTAVSTFSSIVVLGNLN